MTELKARKWDATTHFVGLETKLETGGGRGESTREGGYLLVDVGVQIRRDISTVKGRRGIEE